jgi:predicted ATPase
VFSSVRLLTQRARAVVPGFEVFTGGATLEAAEQVCAGAGIRADQVLDLLTALADKSLVTVRQGAEGARYRMLEIIRAYGREPLAEAGEQEDLRAAHAQYFHVRDRAPGQRGDSGLLPARHSCATVEAWIRLPSRCRSTSWPCCAGDAARSGRPTRRMFSR